MARILLVEDNELHRDMLSRRLGRHGYEVLTASDGLQGVARAREEQPDLVILDMGLPGLDGWQAARQLKAAPETHAVPIIALTAHAIAGDREKALEGGCDEYETKPVNFARLLKKIRTFLDQVEEL